MGFNKMQSFLAGHRPGGSVRELNKLSNDPIIETVSGGDPRPISGEG